MLVKRVKVGRFLCRLELRALELPEPCLSQRDHLPQVSLVVSRFQLGPVILVLVVMSSSGQEVVKLREVMFTWQLEMAVPHSWPQVMQANQELVEVYQ
jgi:hypothetical protein